MIGSSRYHMTGFQLLFLAAISLLVVVDLCTCESGDHVRLVHGIFRHGDRAPIQLYPTDPNPAELWPAGLGQLTAAGRRQMMQLGSFLRRRYQQLLPELYRPEFNRVESTDWDRTLVSAQALLAGLYPPVGRDVWHPDLPLQPIPVHIAPRSDDLKLAPLVSCGAYRKALHYTSAALLKSVQDDVNAVLRLLKDKSGVLIRSCMSSSFGFLVDTLSIEAEHNLTIPSWTKQLVTVGNITEPLFPNMLVRMKRVVLASLGLTEYLQRFSVGLLLGEVVLHMEQLLRGQLQPPERRMFLYSTHDVFLVPLLSALGVYDFRWTPPSSSCVLIELRYFGSGGSSPPADAVRDHQVYVIYRNDTSREDVQPLNLPECPPGNCSFLQFQKKLHDLINVEPSVECDQFRSESFIPFPQGSRMIHRDMLQSLGITDVSEAVFSTDAFLPSSSAANLTSASLITLMISAVVSLCISVLY